MAKIVLDVEERNIDAVKNILDNLKEGLIRNIEINQRRYVPKTKVLEDEFLPKNTPTTGKYISPNEFKKRLLKGK